MDIRLIIKSMFDVLIPGMVGAIIIVVGWRVLQHIIRVMNFLDEPIGERGKPPSIYPGWWERLMDKILIKYHTTKSRRKNSRLPPP